MGPGVDEDLALASPPKIGAATGAAFADMLMGGLKTLATPDPAPADMLGVRRMLLPVPGAIFSLVTELGTSRRDCTTVESDADRCRFGTDGVAATADCCEGADGTSQDSRILANSDPERRNRTSSEDI